MPRQPDHETPAESKVVGVPQWLMAIAVGAFVTTSVAAVGNLVQQQARQAAETARSEEQRKALDEFKSSVNARLDKFQDLFGDRWTATQAAARAAQDRAERIALEARLMDSIRSVETRAQDRMAEIQRQMRGK